MAVCFYTHYFASLYLSSAEKSGLKPQKTIQEAVGSFGRWKAPSKSLKM
jgi:hypothetical protein